MIPRVVIRVLMGRWVVMRPLVLSKIHGPSFSLMDRKQCVFGLVKVNIENGKDMRMKKGAKAVGYLSR